MNCRIIYFISKYHFPPRSLWPQIDRRVLLLGNLMSFCGEAVDVFCVSMVNLPRCTQDNNESSQRPAEWCGRVLNGLSYCGTWRSYTTWRSPWECFLPPPSSRGFWDRQRLGLLAKRMTHGMTKLLCLSVRLGLYPTDICWLRLIQAPEKPGIRVRHRWLFFFPFAILSHARFRTRGRKKNVFKSSSCFYRLSEI